MARNKLVVPAQIVKYLAQSNTSRVIGRKLHILYCVNIVLVVYKLSNTVN